MRNHCTFLPSWWSVTKKMNKHGVCLRHDQAYMLQLASRKEIDIYFYKDCIDAGVSVFWAGALYYACRLGGCFLWYRRKWKRGCK